MKEHFSPKKNKIMPCDEAIIKYGIPEEIEILEEIQDKNKLQEREKYWINYYSTNNKNNGYNLTSGGEALYRDDNFWSVLNELEVIDIRKRRANLERKIDVYQDYKNKISFSGFEKIWLGTVSQNIGKEYLDKMKKFSKKEICGMVNQGELSCKSKLKTDDVLLIRKRYSQGETIKEIQKDYSFVSMNTIRRVCNRETWKHI